MILGTCIAILATGCSSLHHISLSSYMAARFFQGLGASPAATVGLSIINDLSFEHQRGFRVGLWVLSIDLGTYAGILSRSSLQKIFVPTTLADSRSYSRRIPCIGGSILGAIPCCDPLRGPSGIGGCLLA